MKNKKKFITPKIEKKGINLSIYYPHPIPYLNYYGLRNKFPLSGMIAYDGFTLPKLSTFKKKDLVFLVKNLKNYLDV